MKESDKFHKIVKRVLKNNKLFVSQESLFHFTDINGLFGIIKDDSLWLSERNYMNDINDEIFIKSYVRNFFTKSTDEWEKFETELIPHKNQYIFSTSTDKDSIHQWTYYGSKDSYCIEFDIEELINLFYKFNETKDLYYGPVLYENEKTLKIANKIITEYSSLLYDKNSIFNIENDNFDDEKFSEFKRVYQYFYSLIKQAGHSCENEYRFTLQKENNPEFRTRNGLFIPYIVVNSMETINKKLPIKKIYIGPNSYETKAKENLEYFLKKNNYENVVVDKSEMNIRR